MFKNLFDFAYTRTLPQAIGFYLAWFVIIVVLSAIGGGIGGLIYPEDAFNQVMVIGQAIAIIVCAYLSIIIMRKKKLSGIMNNLIALSALILVFIVSSLGGLIPIAYLTTRETTSNNPPKGSA